MAKKTKLTEMINPMTDGNEHLRDPVEEVLEDTEEVVTGRRILTMNEKPVFELVCLDPTGFWAVRTKKGALPNELTGRWTTQHGAQRAVEAYLLSR